MAMVMFAYSGLLYCFKDVNIALRREVAAEDQAAETLLYNAAWLPSNCKKLFNGNVNKILVTILYSELDKARNENLCKESTLGVEEVDCTSIQLPKGHVQYFPANDAEIQVC